MNFDAFSLISSTSDYLVVNKEAGVSFHTEADQPGLCRLVELALDQKVYPVHRLDKATSGLVILPTSSTAAAAFSNMFQTRTVEKYYLAFSAQKPRKKQGWVIGDMVRGRAGNWKLTRGTTNPAVTYFYSTGVDMRSLIPDTTSGRGFVLKIYSGKTHQIRVALKSMGAPILGDSRYAGANQPGSGSRLFLHAWNVRFQWKNQWVEYSAPLDTAWASLAEQLPGSWSQPWRLHWPVHKMQRREE